MCSEREFLSDGPMHHTLMYLRQFMGAIKKNDSRLAECSDHERSWLKYGTHEPWRAADVVTNDQRDVTPMGCRPKDNLTQQLESVRSQSETQRRARYNINTPIDVYPVVTFPLQKIFLDVKVLSTGNVSVGVIVNLAATGYRWSIFSDVLTIPVVIAVILRLLEETL